MYVTRPLSLYRKSPESLLLPPPEGPNSGYLVICDEESETTTCCGLCIDNCIRGLPFPQNKDLTVSYSIGAGKSRRTYYDHVAFIPVLNQPLASNRYYVIRQKGRHKGKACTNSKEDDMGTCCWLPYIQDLKPRPLDPTDINQQVEIIQKNRRGYTAIAQDGFPPLFLRRKYWTVYKRTPRNYQLDEALGLNSSLRASFPDFNFSLSNESSEAMVVGKWYCPFMFVHEEMKFKDQIKMSMFYEMTLEQRWSKIYACENIKNDRKDVVSVDVFVEREEVCVGGRKAVWERRNGIENGVMWFKSCNDMGAEQRVGLSVLIVERMKWEQERVGLVAGGKEKRVRVERREEFGGKGGWSKFGCYLLMERFVLKRIDGSVVLTYDFKHTHEIRGKWE
ncbi:uncharacterized protein LOC107429108 [Ziziphus jujuba]|uniref:Uncharacterized protein LOC107429108 n=1 Tax=Ziziphus jujuba TaxID=326968 RepID=A0A6P4AEH7_ZIZJJ|nr:uncharacterized protein LOC107429108 [Ziziphus jujuba]